MRALGWSDEMLPRILEQFKTHTGSARGLSERGLNLNAWTDLEARSHFELGVNRWARKIIQENDLGAMPTWLQHRGIKVALQFRTFMIGSYFKQTLHNVHMRDPTSYAIFMCTAFSAAAAFTGRSYIASFGRPEGKERDDFWKEKVTGNGYANLALNTFQNMGVASVIPMMFDGAAFYGTGGKAHIFNGRSSGLQSDPVFGNPTADLTVTAAKAIGGVISPLLHLRAPSQPEANAVLRTLPYMNSVLIARALSWLTSGLPEKTPGGEWHPMRDD